jgi:O-antigen ligase
VTLPLSSGNLDHQPGTGVGKPQSLFSNRWKLMLVLAVLLPLLTHGLLPAIGVYQIAEKFSWELLSSLTVALIGLVFYYLYFEAVVQKPLYLALYSSVFIRISFYFASLAQLLGKHIPIRSLHMPLLVLPGYYLCFSHFSELWKQYSYFKYVFTFLCFFVLYYVFFNFNFVDPVVAKISGISVSKGQVIDYIYATLGIILPGALFLRIQSPESRIKTFNLINQFLITMALIEAGLSILGYPLGLFTMKVEGFRRTSGIMEHPNAYGKITGLFLIYMIGLYYYYIKNPKLQSVFFMLLMQITLAANFLAFLLTLSKNAFGGVALACVFYLLSALFDASLRKKLLLPLALLTGLMVLILAGYQMVSDKGLMDLLTERFNDTRSLEWRTRVWGYLLSNIDKNSIWFGHGLSACNMEMYRYQYNDAIASDKQSIYVHNAFIQFIYDMGIVGLGVFAGLINVVVTSSVKFFREQLNPLYLCILGLSCFVLIGALTDECITEFHMNFMYWFMVTLIISFIHAQKQISNRPQANDTLFGVSEKTWQS